MKISNLPLLYVGKIELLDGAILYNKEIAIFEGFIIINPGDSEALPTWYPVNQVYALYDVDVIRGKQIARLG